MCPIWPLHLIVLYILAMCPLWVLCQAAPKLTATFPVNNITIEMDKAAYLKVNVTGSNKQVGDVLALHTSDSHLADVGWNSTYRLTEADVNNNVFSGNIKVTGKFLGRTNVKMVVKRGDDTYPVAGNLPVIVVRPTKVINLVFHISVGLFVSLLFINFGCAMHWPTVMQVLKRPIGPLIGMFGQFVFMPLMSFGLGYLIFPQSAAMRLGMFFTGVAPAGGASNIWTCVLGGNLDMSLAMTSMSMLAAYAFMPLWLFTLGQVVFHNANIVVPYKDISTLLIAMLVPLAIGLGMQRWTPRISAFMVRILKGFSTTLLLFIIIFAIATNVYIFQLFSWQIVLAGMGIPWLGYLFGYLLARICRQPTRDALAISIETGVQNTGIAIFLLRYALQQPEADLTTVVPVAVAIMTPVPMTCIYIYQKIKACIIKGQGHKEMLEEDATPTGATPNSSFVSALDHTGGEERPPCIDQQAEITISVVSKTT